MSELLRKRRSLSFAVFGVVFFSQMEVQRIFSELRKGVRRVVSPLGWAASEWAELSFSSFNKKPPVSLSQLQERGSYHQLSQPRSAI